MLRAVLIAFAFASLAGPVCAQGQRLAEPAWWQRTTPARTKHYVIRTDLPLDEARRYGRHLDLMYEEYERRLASLPPRAPHDLTVYAFRRQDEYLRTLSARWGVDATGTGGIFFVRPSGSGLAFWTGSLPRRRVEHVIQHEGFHQFAWSRFGGDLPMWANEGLAELFGEGILVGDHLVLGQSTPRVLDAVSRAIEQKRSVPFREMLSMTSERWNEGVQSGGGQIEYAQAWSMVQFLVYGEDARYQPAFERYLRLLNNGTPSDAAFAEVFGTDVEAFETRWSAYALAAKPSAFATALERIEFLAEGALELSRRGTVPGSLDALRDALRAIGFEHTLERHGQNVVLRAADDDSFLIPRDELTPDQPAFAVSDPKLRLSSRRDRQLEQQHRTPSAITTEYLRPRGLVVEWHRDGETGAFGYEIAVGRE